MSDQIVIERTSDGTGTDDPRVIIHIFPGSGARGGAVPGDVALCGLVKTTTLHKEDTPRHLWVRCVVCYDLRWSGND